MMSTESMWDIPVFNAFKTAFLQDPGIHLLGLGQTNSGKTQKAYQLVKWLMEAGEHIIWFDCGKTGEILPLATLDRPLHIVSPAGCDVAVAGVHVPVTYDHCITPEETWTLINPDAINVFSFRAFFRDSRSFGAYAARVMLALENAAYDDPEMLPKPLSIFIDEFADVCPSHGLQDTRHLRRTASRVSMVLKRCRAEGYRICAFDQAWTDIYPNARRQFPFLLVCRTPNLIGHDIQSLERYRGLFEKLAVDEGLMVFPNRTWTGYWHFPLFKRPEDSTIKYTGRAHVERSKPKDEDWDLVEGDERPGFDYDYSMVRHEQGPDQY